MTRARAIPCTLAALIAAISCGCGGGGAGGSELQARTDPSPRLGLDVDRSASVDGVELRWWATNDNAAAAANALASVMEPGQVLPGDLASHWEESGLRLVRVRRDALDALLKAAPPAGQYSRDWKGWMGQWLPVFRGAPVGRRSPFTIAGKRRMLGPGSPRVLMRAWPAPTALGPVVRLDLALQFINDQASLPDGPGGGFVPANTPPVSAGTVIEQLTAELALDPNFVYVLTSEAPGVRWNDDTPRAQNHSEPSAAGPAPAGSGKSITLGELLFSFAIADHAQKRKVLVVIVPELSSGFALLPHDADQ